MVNKLLKCILPIVFILSAGAAFIYPFDIKTVNAKDNSVTVYYEDFSYDAEGEKPYTLAVTEMENSTARVVMAKTEEGKYKNMLKLTDTAEKSLASVNLSIPEYKNSVTLEMKFKLTRTTTVGYGFIMDFMGNGKQAFRIYKHSGQAAGLSFANNGGTMPFTCGIDMNDKWFTLKIRLDSSEKISSLALYNELYGTQSFDTSEYNFLWQDKENSRLVYYNQPWYREYNEGNLTNIVISTYGITAGECLIDYITLYETNEEYRPSRVRAESKDIEKSVSPKMRLVPDRVNIVFKNEVKYFAYPPFIKDGAVMADASKVAEWYGLSYVTDGESCILTGNDTLLVFKKGAEAFTHNNEEKSLLAVCEVTEDTFFVPVENISGIFGDAASFDKENEALYINKKSVFYLEGYTAYLTPEEAIADGMLVIAGYDDKGKLLNISYKEGEFKKDEKASVSLDNTLSYFKTAVYLWDRETLAPLEEPLIKINY